MSFFRMPDVFYTKPAEPTHKKLKYGKKPMQTINVRIPDGDGPFPTIITLHGGQWKKAYTHKQTEYLCEDLKQHGIATCNIEFKRLGHVDGGYPGTFLDLYAGIEYILEHTEVWKIDRDRLSILGHSSGGHLAFCLIADHTGLGFTPHAAIGIAGVYDLANAREKLQPCINEFFGEHPKLSPIELLPMNTRQLLIVGEEDKLVEQALSYVEKAQEVDDITLEIIDGCGHFRIIDPTFEGWHQIRDAIIAIAT